jgi:capsular polysaccharide biosynthesis protein
MAATVSLSTAFVADFMDPSFRTPEELAGYLNIPVLAALPKGNE